MGRFDSSKTRVQPIFKALHSKDRSGHSWLKRLLRLGGRGKPPSETGELTQPPIFELSADPPRDFLSWLVKNRTELRIPTYKVGAATLVRRQKLMSGDPDTVAAALNSIDHGSTHGRQWWRLEGTTKVDCALRTNRLTLFIEGKRTEAGPSESTSWYPHRNQILRNLDCARWHSLNKGGDYFVMGVIEKDLDGNERTEAMREVEDFERAALALPHLRQEELRDVMDHYLGFTTWQDIVREFSLDESLVS